MKYFFLATVYFTIGYVLPTFPLFFQITTCLLAAVFAVAIMTYFLQKRLRLWELDGALFQESGD